MIMVNQGEYLVEKIKASIKKLGLPGKESQYKMAPKGRIKEIEADQQDISQARASAVMILLHPNKEQQLCISLIQRPTYEGVHSGQAAFPGGQYDLTDTDYWHTSLRETFEEVGIAENTIERVAEITPLYIPPSNFMVYPFIGYHKSIPQFTADQREVEQIYEISLREILMPENKLSQDIPTSYGVFKDVPIYKIQNLVVWGATAMILSEFEKIISNTEVF